MLITETDKFIFSYETKVAEVKNKYVRPLGHWSMTTSKHINYAAQQLGLPVLK
jgi:hypothetical protein